MSMLFRGLADTRSPLVLLLIGSFMLSFLTVANYIQPLSSSFLPPVHCVLSNVHRAIINLFFPLKMCSIQFLVLFKVILKIVLFPLLLVILPNIFRFLQGYISSTLAYLNLPIVHVSHLNFFPIFIL